MKAKAKIRPPARPPSDQGVGMSRRVFGLFPTKDGDVIGFLEVDEKTFRAAKKRADKSGLSPGEEISAAMYGRGENAIRTGRRVKKGGA